MFSKLDDALIDHRKIFDAGDLIGKNGPAIALGFFTVGLLWSNKQLSNGFLPMAVVKRFRHVENPLNVARALVTAHLWENADGGFLIHDFLDWNLDAKTVQDKRKADRERKRNGGRNRHGHHVDS
jgi:hypothetical protein